LVEGDGPPVDLVDYVRASDATERLERMRELGRASQLSGTVEVWLADDGRPARVAAELKPVELSGSVRVTSDVLAYDVPVDATEPPPAIVATESEVAQGG
jgi:hypothetical protein